MPADPLIEHLLESSSVHAQWRELLAIALETIDRAYLAALVQDQDWLPGIDKLLAAFQRDRTSCRYILFGESPYPRRQSANGIAFHDAAVRELWSATGLSRDVNRATSLRNLVKATLLAEQLVETDRHGKVTQAAIAMVDKRSLVTTIDELFANLRARGVLLLNATPVLHPARKPAVEATYWKDFMEALLQQIPANNTRPPTLLLWGKIAQRLEALPCASAYPRLVCEHPYNLTFIHNRDIQHLLSRLQILQRNPRAKPLQPSP